jgi:hypothetical protein
MNFHHINHRLASGQSLWEGVRLAIRGVDLVLVALESLALEASACEPRSGTCREGARRSGSQSPG